MMKKTKKLITAALVLACGGLFGGAVGVSASNVSATTTWKTYTQSFTMDKGAKVLFDGENTGIRFTALMDSAEYQNLMALNSDTVKISFGVVVMPYDYVTADKALTEENLFGENKKYCFEDKATCDCSLTHVSSYESSKLYEDAEKYGQFWDEEYYSYFADMYKNGWDTSDSVVYVQKGVNKALEAFYDIFSPEGRTMVGSNDTSTGSFAILQTNFLQGEAMMMVNGGWLETEMSKNQSGEQVKDRDVRFMKTPVLSSIVETLENDFMSDRELSQVIDYIDGGKVGTVFKSIYSEVKWLGLNPGSISWPTD